MVCPRAWAILPGVDARPWSFYMIAELCWHVGLLEISFGIQLLFDQIVRGLHQFGLLLFLFLALRSLIVVKYTMMAFLSLQVAIFLKTLFFQIRSSKCCQPPSVLMICTPFEKRYPPSSWTRSCRRWESSTAIIQHLSTLRWTCSHGLRWTDNTTK